MVVRPKGCGERKTIAAAWERSVDHPTIYKHLINLGSAVCGSNYKINRDPREWRWYCEICITKAGWLW